MTIALYAVKIYDFFSEPDADDDAGAELEVEDGVVDDEEEGVDDPVSDFAPFL